MNATVEAKVFEALEEQGLLLVSDPQLPSLAALVAGERVRGSWWSHPKSHEIYAASARVCADPRVTTAKLVSGKVTLVHRRLWPALLGVARSGRPWQTTDLPRAAATLLRAVEREGSLRLDHLEPHSKDAARADAEAARELELRLLVHSDDVHTESGTHAKLLRTWSRWRADVGFDGDALVPDVAERELGDLMARLNQLHRGKGKLPWQS